MRLLALFLVASATALLSSAGQPLPPPGPEEPVLLAAGLSTDGDALLQFFRERTRPKADLADLLRTARQLGDPSADKRAQAKARLLGSGPWALPALRHVVNDLDNALAARQARHCLDWLEGKRGAELPIAAARLLAARKPAEAAGTLLAFLPFADDAAVVEGVKTALDGIAARPGKVDGALLAALADPLPLRRAVAAEVLAGSGRAEVLPEIRKLLADAKPQVRLRAVLALTQQLDEKAVATLIDLLLELPPTERRQAEQALHQLAGAWSPAPLLTAEDDTSRKLCHAAWTAWWRTVDGPALTAAFRQRTLTAQDTAAVQALVAQLGAKSFAKRERAVAQLSALGTKVVALLRAAEKSTDPEVAQRAGLCLQAIAKNEARDRLPLTAPRLLAIRDPAGASEALLAYLPFSDDRALSAEIVKSLTLLARVEGKAKAALVKALSDPLPLRRLTAAEILAGAGGAAHPALRKLLTDADPQVRLQVALALVHARDREAVPALIELVAELPGAQAWEADDVLRRLAGAKAPARPSGEDAAARRNLRAAWQGWWKDHGALVNLAALERTGFASGLIVVAEVGPNRGRFGPGKGGFPPRGFNPPMNPPGGAGAPPLQPGGGKKGRPAPGPANPRAAGSDRLVGVDRQGQVQWQIEDLENPIDFQILPGGRVLLAEYAIGRVTERDLKGRILWEIKNLPGRPMNVQRLANGNTFVALYGTAAATGGYSLLEVDRQGKTVQSIIGNRAAAAPGGFAKGTHGNPRAGYKMPDGQMVCLASRGVCIRLDANGKEIKQFPVAGLLGGVTNVIGNIDVTPKGNILVAQTNNAVVEYDPDGKVVWKAAVAGNRATRLANGNTLVASETAGVFEVDPAGKTVWRYQPPAGYHAVRARQASYAGGR